MCGEMRERATFYFAADDADHEARQDLLHVSTRDTRSSESCSTTSSDISLSSLGLLGSSHTSASRPRIHCLIHESAGVRGVTGFTRPLPSHQAAYLTQVIFDRGRLLFTQLASDHRMVSSLAPRFISAHCAHAMGLSVVGLLLLARRMSSASHLQAEDLTLSSSAAFRA